MSLIDNEPVSNVAEFSVSELSNSLKKTVEDAFGHVRVRGEVSGYRGPHSSGHAYFSLKDEKARIDAVIWRTSFSKLAFKPQEGLEIIATGRLTTYPGSSKYQIVIEDVKPAGAGALMALLDDRRRKFEAEGLFAPERKKPLPFLPGVIGVVTSPTGAVIKDIRHRITDRFPVHVLVWPVKVQGEGSGDAVAAAITGFNAIDPGGKIPRPDVIIVARGGGSLEDLWGFNDEAVVRAAADSRIPLISAVGHETDWTLIDHVADRRAPTPTGAAEIAVPVRAELMADLAAFHARQQSAISRRLDHDRRQVAQTARALPSPDMLLALPRRRLDDASSGLDSQFLLTVSHQRQTFGAMASRLSLGTLEAAVRDKRSGLRHTALEAEQAVVGRLSRLRQHFQGLTANLQPIGLKARSDAARFKLDALSERFDRTESRITMERRDRVSQVWRVASSLGPQKVLERGYAILRGENDEPITDPAALPAGTVFVAEFSGKRRVGALSTGPTSGDGLTPKPKRRRRKTADEEASRVQGSLFEG
ncbi:exodeoxyribonuclease VII large subunit [Fulvimarina sp. 2208YS6-2-32]|uniref:Exodeoxyribonuclease 7 large subunit n=1 Tax=Fulvimarina uroteuthidis TaxID=3098149 RepID=A0ABU5HYZ6_9HYPH|nr:exodeoxyribonuclease VII large subunit [Fulvimarina sp. 2208YS6-2-32]MDY8108191.1 exodeoxyribonuclease VII large subunit [Fulvimarina sp. 2208YS6-2-32]